MKKILSLVLVLVMLSALTACGAKYEAADADDLTALATKVAVLEQKQKDMDEKMALSERIAALEAKVEELENRSVSVAYIPAAATEAAPVETAPAETAPAETAPAETAPTEEPQAEAAPAENQTTEAPAATGDLPAVTAGSCQLPAILTSVGQSADVDIVATHCKKIKLDVYQNNTIKAEELTNKYKTIILAVGGSNKGLGAAGIDADQELARTDALIAMEADYDWSAGVATRHPVRFLHQARLRGGGYRHHRGERRYGQPDARHPGRQQHAHGLCGQVQRGPGCAQVPVRSVKTT